MSLTTSNPENQLNPMEDGFFHRIHLDRKLNFHDLQEGSVVSTIATKKGSSLIRLGARQRTEEEQQPIKSKCPEVHEYRLLAIARYKAPTTFPPSTTAVSLDPTRQNHPTRPEDGPRKKAPKIPKADSVRTSNFYPPGRFGAHLRSNRGGASRHTYTELGGYISNQNYSSNYERGCAPFTGWLPRRR